MPPGSFHPIAARAEGQMTAPPGDIPQLYPAERTRPVAHEFCVLSGYTATTW
jgi:hypothetical protein